MGPFPFIGEREKGKKNRKSTKVKKSAKGQAAELPSKSKKDPSRRGPKSDHPQPGDEGFQTR